jgi:hypothetical protein
MRILYLFPRQLHATKMSPGRRLYGDALARQPGVSLTWSGIGWPGYDPAKTVTENCGPADAAIVYKGEGLRGLDEIPVRVCCFNEANHEKTLQEVHDAHANLVVFHHGNDIPRWTFPPYVRTAHILHCADPVDGPPIANRPIPVLLTGVTSPEVYPLRNRFAQLIRTGKIPGVIRRHPGNRLKSHDRCQQQYADYRQQLAQAKIVLCCSSSYRYPLAKFVEAFASGAAVIGDMPDDRLFQDTLGKYLIQIHPNTPDPTITATVKHWLKPNNAEELQQRAHAGYEMVRGQFTTDHYARRLLDEIEKPLEFDTVDERIEEP